MKKIIENLSALLVFLLFSLPGVAMDEGEEPNRDPRATERLNCDVTYAPLNDSQM